VVPVAVGTEPGITPEVPVDMGEMPLTTGEGDASGVGIAVGLAMGVGAGGTVASGDAVGAAVGEATGDATGVTWVTGAGDWPRTAGQGIAAKTAHAQNHRNFPPGRFIDKRDLA